MATTDSTAVSNVTYTSFFATRFARRRERVTNKSSTKIQSLWRMEVGKRAARQAKKEKAATDINKHARRLFATRVMTIKKEEKKRKETRAMLLQRSELRRRAYLKSSTSLLLTPPPLSLVVGVGEGRL